MIRAQKLLIDLSEEEKVDRYLASDYTGDYTKLDYGDIVEKDPMKDIKAYLDTKPNIKGVHVLIGVFVETFLDLMGTWDSNTRTIRYWGTGTERRDLMSYRKAAQYVAAVVLDPNAIGILKFLGDRKDIVEIAGDLEAVYKFKPALENYGSLEELYLRRSQKEGFEAAVA
ncbi:hypothetical protein DL95DRAFT_397729 [Leptodontidium sp. 2 PMI_412]|nr:hypothetical protein DL95DRAFT_397729 [Leptodontidium sp. 2 PMI_412]